MRDVIPSTHSVYRWVVDGFDGGRFGQRVYWNAITPRSGRPAEHGPAYSNYSPYIAISGGTETTAVDKWAAVVYEMHNLENSKQFAKLAESVMAGLLDADSYAEKCVELEFVALTKTRDFFHGNPLPKSSHGRDVWYNWATSELGTYEEYKERLQDSGGITLNSNFGYFKDYYEKTLLPYSELMRQTE